MTKELMINRQTVSALRLLSDHLRTVEADFPVSYLTLLLYVEKLNREMGEPPSMIDISRATGMNKNVVSRIVGAMSDRRLGSRKVRDATPAGAREAMGLLAKGADNFDSRVVRVTLTSKGWGLLTRLTSFFDKDT